MKSPAALTFNYGGDTLQQPLPVQYGYKLDGFDLSWNEVGSSQRLATYTNLDPGNYTFRLQGANSDGVWNESGVSFPILIEAPWWRTNAFRVSLAAVFLVLLWAVFRLRLYQMSREFAVQTEERSRIARELHDTLLQSFQASLMQMQGARNLFDRFPAKVIQSLDEAIAMAARGVAEGRSAIQDSRSPTEGKEAWPAC